MHDLLERDAPLAAVWAAVERLGQGGGRIVLVTGEAGIGKSSLAQAVVQGLQSGTPGLRAWWAHGEDLSAPRPLGPLHDIAPQLGGRLPECLERGAPVAQVFDALADVLASGPHPAILLIEDLHWADEATLDLVRLLGRRIDRFPLLLWLSVRDGEFDPAGRLQRVLGELPAGRLTRLALPPLSPAAVHALARAAGRSASGLHAATGGNPFYVTEVLASGLATADEGVPSTVRQAVLARRARLPPAQRAVLDVLSVVPGRVEHWLAAALLPEAMPEAVDACVDRGLLLADDQALAFRHELARRATLDALPATRRRRLHAQAFEALGAPPPGVEIALARRVHHAAEAGQAQTVLALAPVAAAQAATLGAHRDAARLHALALRFAGQATLPQRAERLEAWSYEAGLSLAIDPAVIQARHDAIAMWRQLNRPDRVGHNLRWLARLHWYQGEQALAERFADEALQVLGGLPDSPELAWAQAMRAQQFMLQDRTGPAIEWGRRAVALARRLGEPEILAHALNSIGTAELFAHRPQGRAKLEESLALSLAGGFHEQAARVYTNLSEHAVVFKDFERAEATLDAGIRFDREHDLEAWTHYLVGWQAQLRLDQGRLDDAERIADEVLATPDLTVVMRLPALTVRARVRARRGDDDGARGLDDALALAAPTREVQRLAPLGFARAERAWLLGDHAACRAALAALDGLPGAGVNPWERGERTVWRARAGDPPEPSDLAVAEPWQLELHGRPLDAAAAWQRIGAPYEAALALLQLPRLRPDQDPLPALREAWDIAVRLGARPLMARTRSIARVLGLLRRLPAPTRGPYGAARRHPHGLTAREQQVWAALAEPLSNAEIAARHRVSVRTVERHVSAVLAKLAVANRAAAAALFVRTSRDGA